MEKVKRIAVIDDDPICQFISSNMIRRFSPASVEIYTDAREALFQLRWRAENEMSIFPDRILLDIDMPLMSGWQFLDELKKLPQTVLERTKIIILSSSSRPYDLQKAKEYRIVSDFFSKPLSEENVRMISSH